MVSRAHLQCCARRCTSAVKPQSTFTQVEHRARLVCLPSPLALELLISLVWMNLKGEWRPRWSWACRSPAWALLTVMQLAQTGECNDPAKMRITPLYITRLPRSSLCYCAQRAKTALCTVQNWSGCLLHAGGGLELFGRPVMRCPAEIKITRSTFVR